MPGSRFVIIGVVDIYFVADELIIIRLNDKE